MPEPSVIEPLIAGTVLIKIVIAVVAGFLGKAVWDYFSGGRVEKTPVYVTTVACQESKRSCSVNELKDGLNKTHEKLETYKAQTDTRLRGIDKRIDESNGDIRAMRKDISDIKQTSAASNAILETIQHGIIKQSDKNI